jgi:hypothetical protein
VYMAARIAELRVQLRGVPESARIQAISDSLDQAERFVRCPGRPWWRRDQAVEGVSLHVAAADAMLLEVQNPDRVWARVPEIVATVQANLPVTDQRRVAVEQIGKALKIGDSTRPSGDDIRPILADALRGAYTAMGLVRDRMRRLRNLVAIYTLIITVILGAIVAIGAVWPQLLPICSTINGKDVCPAGPGPPSHADVPLVALLGLAGAALSMARALSTTGDSAASGCSLVLVNALLKLATGASLAVFGVVLLGSKVVPGVTALTSSAAYLVFAFFFGYAQQLVTARVDERQEVRSA